MAPKKQLDLCIEIDVLTAGTTAEIVNAILEALLYQRNQIPFVYKTYRYYVNKWQEQEDNPSSVNDEMCNVQCFQVQRKKQQATATKEAISSMRQTINNVFDKKPIKSLRFLFGSTVFTAKEAYTIHIPTKNIAVNHFHDHHKISAAKLNQALLSLLTSEDLYGIFSHNLNPTNIYLELELLANENLESMRKDSLENFEIFPKDMLLLPPSCKDIHIHLVQKQCDNFKHEELTCCKELQVFEDLISLNLSCSNDRQTNITKEKNLNAFKNLTSAWWEAEIVVRGFKDQPIKGSNIWT